MEAMTDDPTSLRLVVPLHFGVGEKKKKNLPVELIGTHNY